MNNGIDERAEGPTIEDKKDMWGDYADWPVPGTQNVDLFLRAEGNPAVAGSLGGVAGGGADSLGFTAATATHERRPR